MTNTNWRGPLRQSALAFAVIAAATVAASAHPSAMLIGERTSQPIGHLGFCSRYPQECAIRSSNPTPATLSQAAWARLEALTALVNRTVKPISDLEQYGQAEYWTYPADKGDCEDYALLKRKVLLDEGWSPANLLLTVLRKPDGEGHAVLTVRTDHGDYILDNLTDAVQPWDETAYIYIKRQASYNTGRWVAIRDGQTPLVAAVK